MPQYVKLSIFSLIIASLCFTSVFLFIDSTKGTELPTYMLGDPDVPLFSEPYEYDIYFRFKERGYSGQTLVHLSRYFNYVKIPQTDIFNPENLRDVDILTEYEKRINEHNWVWVAVEADIARKVINVLPASSLSEQEGVLYRFRTGKMPEKVYHITNMGRLRVVTGVKDIFLEEAVLLNVDASYFVDVEPEELFTILKKKELKLSAVGLSYVEGMPEEATSEARERMRRFEKMIQGDGQSS